MEFSMSLHPMESFDCEVGLYGRLVLSAQPPLYTAQP